jgi:hypothetical protein
MRATRRIVIGVLFILIAGCGGAEATSTTGEPVTATTETTTTTTTPTTTTTTRPTTTTTLAPEPYDWASLTMSELTSWRDVEFAEGVVVDLALSCVNSVTGFGAMGQVLFDDMLRVARVGAEAEDGNASVSEASAAFHEWATMAIFVGSLADQAVDLASFPFDALSYIDDIGNEATFAGINALLVSSAVFDTDADQIDQDSMNSMLPGLNDAVIDLLDALGVVDAETLCG